MTTFTKEIDIDADELASAFVKDPALLALVLDAIANDAEVQRMISALVTDLEPAPPADPFAWLTARR